MYSIDADTAQRIQCNTWRHAMLGAIVLIGNVPSAGAQDQHPKQMELERPDSQPIAVAGAQAPRKWHDARLLVRFHPSRSESVRRASLKRAQVKRVLRVYSAVDGLQLVEVAPDKLRQSLEVLRADQDVK